MLLQLLRLRQPDVVFCTAAVTAVNVLSAAALLSLPAAVQMTTLFASFCPRLLQRQGM